MRNRPSLAAALALLLVAAHARAGQVHDRGVTLDEVLMHTELVVTVKLDTPYGQRAQIPVPPSRTEPGKDCGTYNFGVVTGTVLDVLTPREGAPVQKGERIVVFYGNTGALLDLERFSCEGKGSKSPIFERYKGATLTNGGKLTALLRWERGLGWTEAVAGAWLKKPPTPAQLATTRRDALQEDAATNDGMCVVDADCTRAPLTCAPCACGPHPPVARSAAARVGAHCAALGPTDVACAPCPAVGLAAPTACSAMRCVDAQARAPAPPK